MKASVIVLHWVPRIICILAILLISLFAYNSIESYLTVWQQILLFLIHLIPSALLVGLLVIAWKWELLGGILFTILGIGVAPILFQHNFNMDQSLGMSLGFVIMVALPLVMIGILFILSFVKRRKYRLIKPNRVMNR